MSVKDHTAEVNDLEIIKEILDGDKAKYALLMRKYNQRLYRACKGYLQDEAEIEDIMQDAYVKAFQNLSKFEGRSQFSTWLTRILINECLQHLRKTNKEFAMDGNEENEIMRMSDNNNPEKQSLNKELKDILETAISRLPAKYRSIFLMREVEKMSVEETSASLDISESNVKVRLNRAKEMLRNALLESYPAGNLYEFNLVRCERIAAKVLARI
jgi:RNA polymerase sigma-70 factor (ECF subfamily)